jgi:PHP family Zn ribbon phosphoesterase
MESDGLVGGENGRPPFRMLVSLRQIIAEALDVGPNTKTVARTYSALIGAIGSEMDILIGAPIQDIDRAAGERVAGGVARVRRGEVSIEPGFDGQYGTVRVWPEA